jgi:hypothetical protein
MASELDSFMGKDVFAPCRSAPRKNLGTRWVFKIKMLANGSVERYKACLVARGFTQRYGVDFEETFAPACQNDWDMKQVDVKTTYLNAEFAEFLTCSAPDGFKISYASGSRALRLIPEHEPTPPGSEILPAVKLKKALYGLKQAGRAWYQLLYLWLTGSYGAQQSTHDPCIFLGGNPELPTLVIARLLLAALEACFDIQELVPGNGVHPRS